MSSAIRTRQPSLAGQTLYAVIDDADSGQAWNGTAFDAGSGAWSSYVVTMTESGTGTFSATVPAGINTARLLSVSIFRRVGGSPAATDPLVGVGTIDWTGAAVANVATPRKVDLSQPIVDTKAATVGGALNGGWTGTWGKVTRSVSTRVLGVFGAGNGTSTPSATFLLDNALSPNVKTPQ